MVGTKANTKTNSWRNWAGNSRCEPDLVLEPRSRFEVVEIVRRAAAAGQRVKVVGAGHSFTAIACTDGVLLHLDHLDRVVDVDPVRRRVTVEAGITLHRLQVELWDRGYALANLGDIDKQSIAGATSTSTHGTGAKLPGIAHFIVGLELVTGDGTVVSCSADEHPELFHCARVGLGALGIVTQVTLQCVPAFHLHAHEYPAPLDTVLAGLPESAEAHDHFEFYWFPHTESCLVKENNRTDAPVQVRSRGKAWFDDVVLANYALGSICSVGKRIPSAVPKLSQLTATQLGELDVVDRSYRVFCSPRLVRFVEMEYAVPRAALTDALLDIRKVIEREDLKVSFPIEVRVAAADDIPLSTGSGRDSAYLAVHMHKGVSFESYFRAVEEVMNGYEGRPHWGKMHYQDAASLAPRYPQWDRFQAVRRECDPAGRFTNDYLDRVLGPVSG